MKDTKDYVPVNDEEESAINQLEEEAMDLISEQWKDRDLRKLIPLENKRADTVAEALVFKVLLEHRVPKVLYSDQGTEFKNQLMMRIAVYFCTTQKFTLTNSPHSNNVERLHQTLGNLVRMLKSKRLKDLTKWDKLIVMAAHAVNNST